MDRQVNKQIYTSIARQRNMKRIKSKTNVSGLKEWFRINCLIKNILNFQKYSQLLQVYYYKTKIKNHTHTIRNVYVTPFLKGLNIVICSPQLQTATIVLTPVISKVSLLFFNPRLLSLNKPNIFLFRNYWCQKIVWLSGILQDECSVTYTLTLTAFFLITLFLTIPKE